MGLRLGFHYHTPAQKRDGGVYMPGYLGRFIDGLAVHCDQFYCFLHTPRPEEEALMGYRVGSANVKLVDIGPHSSMPERTLFRHQATGPIRKHREDFDVLLIRGPTPLLPFVAASAEPVPVALLLVGDYVAAIDGSSQPRWRGILIRWWAHWNKWAQTRLARRCLTFVNSRKLYEELESIVPHLVETRTTTLCGEDFFEREDTCQSEPYHLLYTGRLVRGKGLLDMVDALALLVRRGQDVVLDLVGWFSEDESLREVLKDVAASKGVRDRLRYHGYRTVGPELFQFYREADLFLIASHSSFEGFPRAIWEAMAHSVPVVATSVGSIPLYLKNEHSALILPPREPVRLADAIERVINSKALRRRLIRNGLAEARENTVERRSIDLVSVIREYVAA